MLILQIQRDDGGIFATLTVGQVWHFTRSLLGGPATTLVSEERV
eukprot:COSAG01_NODE_1158_length_11469_cov_101.645646_9_plen_44_part_00